jgi:hypothetical protein
MNKLKLLFEAGDLTAVEIVAAPLEPVPAQRWCCQFRRRNGTRIALELNRKQQDRNQVRIFNSLDGAFSACHAVGFRFMTVSEL